MKTKMKTLLIVIMAGFLASCTSNQKKMESKTETNPFFTEYGTPFDVPPFDKIKPEHYLPAFKEGIRQQDEEIDAIVNSREKPTFENTIVAMETSGELLRRVSSVFYNLTEANTNKQLQEISKEVGPMLAQHKDNINLNKKLFERVKTVYDEKDNLNLNGEQKKLLEETYKRFVRGGVSLSGEKEKEFREVNKELSKLTLEFGENLLAETNDFKMVIDNKDDLAGLPDFVVEMGAADAKANGMEGKWVYTVDKSSMIPFLQYSANRDLREKIFKAYINRGNNNNEHDNKAIASKIAALRVKRANLLGFPTHAAYVLDDNMAKTPENVYKLMNQVWDAALPVAKNEAETLQSMINAEGNNFKLKPWDWWYYTEKLRKQKYDLDDEQLKPYFELENVRKGMFEVAHNLYGLTFKERFDIPKPHPDAHTFEVFDNDGTHQAILIMDFFPRSSKRGGAWMDTYRKQYKIDGKNYSPIVTMVMNFSKPTETTPSLLTFEEVSTMFHEFGHALHGMLSDCTYRSLSGTSVARDFVEMPSQFMENFASDPQVLKMYAKNYKTGEPIPDELIEKMNATAHFNQGFITVEYTSAAYLDMDWHTLTEPVEKDVITFENAAMNKIGLIPEIVVRYRTPYFAHIFSGGYSAGYYSYLWAEVLDADAFEAFKENGIFDKATATSFRTNILERGGTEDPMVLYEKFRGREPSIEPMLKRKGLVK
jgi:peptidyl-dipeptidase Dcp